MEQMDAVFGDRTGEVEAARRAEIERDILERAHGSNGIGHGDGNGVSRRIVATGKQDQPDI